ncbi:MAG TPA: lycopene cyclase family protein [Leptolyngbyaceae cyanobacterium M65_K2018_010]|nr:lycopene cyclase family protein [Leptolyngbyaceae cyanobacterium M65_K2018_010]
MVDVLVIGAGPAGLSLVAALAEQGLAVQGLAPTPPAMPWSNTYGIWADELEDLGLTSFLSHRWKDCVVHVRGKTLPLHRDYGLLDRDRIQAHWLGQAEQGQVQWHQGKAMAIHRVGDLTQVTTETGTILSARLVIDATGHQSNLLQRSPHPQLAFQAAYGLVGRFSKPPIEPHQMVLMDYRDDHLSPEEQQTPPTFLYAMDLGDDLYFVEETSLAHHPAIAIATLEHRLYQRLHHRGVEVKEVHHIERCLFPMNLPLPDFSQPVVGFGGAASMVHPASGYMVGALLRRGPGLAQAVATSLKDSRLTSTQVAQTAWQALWPPARLRKHFLYLFGLENLMAFNAAQLNHFFEAFFQLETEAWSGFLADSLSLPELIQAMVGLFGRASNDVRWGLMRSVVDYGSLLGRSLLP